MNEKEYRKNDLENCVDLLFNLALESIKDHKIKENLSHEEYKEEIKTFNEILNDNPLNKEIPFIKEENRKKILEEYKKIVIEFVTFTYKINEYTIKRKDINNMSFEEKKKIVKDYLLS